MEKEIGKADLSKGLVSVDALYSESSQMFRHYSNCSLTIRLSAIIQGLAIASASGYLFQEGKFLYPLVAALFGLFFTGVLFGIYWAYDQAIVSFHDTLKRLEGEVTEEVSRDVCPFSAFAAMREKRYKSFVFRLITLYGAFFSVGMAFVAMAVLSALQLAK